MFASLFKFLKTYIKIVVILWIYINFFGSKFASNETRFPKNNNPKYYVPIMIFQKYKDIGLSSVHTFCGDKNYV
jgi:hypothetical protein